MNNGKQTCQGMTKAPFTTKLNWIEEYENSRKVLQNIRGANIGPSRLALATCWPVLLCK